MFDSLYKIKIIDKDFLVDLKQMAKIRNKLVHVYWEIDHKVIFDLLQTELSDIKKFMQIAIDYVKDNT
ncbi:DUF86 domain-containing protein [Clostridium grantii]|nr:HepT-like ribonuclease domain-containing protein [Clostridium grantii]